MIWPFRRNKAYSEEEVLNESFHLAMSWGKDWLQPTQERLMKLHPNLSQKELDRYNSIAQSAMKYGHDKVYDMAEKSGKKTSEKEFIALLKNEFPWVNDKNAKHCFSQGMYYAWKDNGLS